MSKLRVAVVGTGHWGKNLVRNFDSLAGVELKTICDLDPAVCEVMGRAYPAAVVTGDLDEVLADPALQAVVVSVQASRHHSVCRKALLAGKHVMVEKPMALSVRDAEELQELAGRQRLVLMVGHLLEYHPAVTYIKEMIRKGRIGDPLYLYFQRVNLGVLRESENAWWSLAPHDVSLACHFFDAVPISVSASGQAYLREGLEDVVFANLRFADGRMAHIHVSWLDPHKIRKAMLVGTQRMVVFDDMEAAEKIRIYDKGADVKRSVESYVEAITLRSGDIHIPKISSAEPLHNECQHFVDCIRNSTPPLSDAADGVRVVRVLEAGSASIAMGGTPVNL